MGSRKQLFLSSLDQKGIDELVKEFDEILPRLKYIYDDIVKFISPKYSSLHKEIHSKIQQQINQIESSCTFDVVLEVFAIHAPLSKRKPALLDIIKHINPTFQIRLPWDYHLGYVYSDQVEKDFLNVNNSRGKVVTQIHEYKYILKTNPVYFSFLIKQMKDPFISNRCHELLNNYTILSLAEDFGAEVDAFSVVGTKSEKDDSLRSTIKKEILDLIKQYYDQYKKYINEESYNEPSSSENLNLNELLDRCEQYKLNLLSMKNNNANLISEYEEDELKLFLDEYCNLLKLNNYQLNNILEFLPSTTLNKLQGGSALVRKIGIKVGYREFEKYFRKNIVEYLSNIKYVSGEENKGTARNPANL